MMTTNAGVEVDVKIERESGPEKEARRKNQGKINK
ncbi:hypothetical protein SLEP1_g29701 [Rubroshorea leprosula]|uniref:Uncharacterized protein n=1 Tax=Rubroshorea leprosula TaxID=152421 RepID=A0AAV5K8A1_9ROSI|nr:hypothetical protein SLEP1_g29701 [Rubroshorea leprosula]